MQRTNPSVLYETKKKNPLEYKANSTKTVGAGRNSVQNIQVADCISSFNKDCGIPTITIRATIGIKIFIVDLSRRPYQLISNIDVNRGNRRAGRRTFLGGPKKFYFKSTINFQS